MITASAAYRLSRGSMMPRIIGKAITINAKEGAIALTVPNANDDFFVYGEDETDKVSYADVFAYIKDNQKTFSSAGYDVRLREADTDSKVDRYIVDWSRGGRL